MTHYDVLGIERTVTTQEIKVKRDKLALIYHPDRNKSVDAEEKMKQINEAYEVLSDENKRKEYDKTLVTTFNSISKSCREEYDRVGQDIRKKREAIKNKVEYLLTVLPGIEENVRINELQAPLLTLIIGYGSKSMLEKILPYYSKEELHKNLKEKDEDDFDCIEHLTNSNDGRCELLFSKFDIVERWNIILPYVKNQTLSHRLFSNPNQGRMDDIDKVFFDDSLYFEELNKKINGFFVLNTPMSKHLADSLLILRNDLLGFAEKQRINNTPWIKLQQTPEMELLR